MKARTQAQLQLYSPGCHYKLPLAYNSEPGGVHSLTQ